MSYDDYVKYVDASMPQESPLLLGLHGNAELGFLNSSVEKLFFSILQMGGSGGDAGADDVTKVVRKCPRLCVSLLRAALTPLIFCADTQIENLQEGS